jgi:hypothetical protein
MPRPRAVDAMNFIQGRKLRTQALLCGEPVLPEGDQVETALAQPAGPVAGPQQPPPFTGNPPPIGVPTVPVPSPGPPATPPPTVPTPLPTQSPASPVTVGE